MFRLPPFFYTKRNCLLLFCTLVLCVQPISSTLPLWLKPGAWVEYEFRLYSLRFLNGTALSSDSGFGTTFQIKCLSVKGNIAEMDITLKDINQSVYLSTKVCVNSETRDVTLLDGKSVGKTLLWLPANPKQGESLALTDDKTADVETGGFMATCQGFQKFFRVWNDSYSVDMAYDLDTGVLIQGLFTEETTMLALNISRVIADSVKLASTNIDLGPGEWLPEIIYALPLLLPLTAFTFILIFVLRRQRRRRKTHAHR